MKKLALCFMLKHKLECESLWHEWLSGYAEKVSIYVHAKERIRFTTSTFRNAIQIPTMPTKWGDASLVRVTLALYARALQDPDNVQFVLLSGDCIPIKAFSYVYDTLMQTSTFSRYGRMSTKDEVFHRHHQWIVVSREHAQLAVEREPWIHAVCEGRHASDEMWFTRFLRAEGRESEVIIGDTTFTNWKQRDLPSSPKTYFWATEDDMITILNTSCLFARKFKSWSFRKVPHVLQMIQSQTDYKIQYSSTVSLEEACCSQPELQSDHTVSDLQSSTPHPL